jgi:hypothetical protein
MATRTPYGSWESLVDAAQALSRSVGFTEIRVSMATIRRWRLKATSGRSMLIRTVPFATDPYCDEPVLTLS